MEGNAKQVEDKSKASPWNFVLDHPKVAGFLAAIALAVAFSPKASAIAAWILIIVAFVFGLFMILGVANRHDWRKPITAFALLFLLIGLGGFGAWLTDAKSDISSTWDGYIASNKPDSLPVVAHVIPPPSFGFDKTTKPSPAGGPVDRNKVLAGEIAKEVAKIVPRQHDYQIFPQDQLHISDSLNSRKSQMPKLRGAESADHAIIQQSSTGDCSPNIIGSGNTNNCNQPPKVIASAQTQTMTGNSEVPWEVRFTISATGLVQTGDLRLKCSGFVIRAGISRINSAELITGSNGPDANDPRTVVYELGAETLSPKQTVTIVVYSKEPITVLSGTIGHEQIVF